jgi:hypothetical protein
MPQRVRAWCAVFLAIVSTIACTPTAHAQSSAVNLQISPLPIILDVKPGNSVGVDLRVRNASAQTVKLKTSVRPFSTEGPSGRIVFRDPRPSDDFVNWISFSKSLFDAPGGQWQTVHMNVDVPKDAAFGYYWAVQFELANPPKAAPGTTSIRGAVAIFVLLNADAPGAKRSVQVTSFTTDKKSYEFLPVNFNVAVHNNGNVHLAPHGNIFIKRGSKDIASLEINHAGGYVLPGAGRVLSSEWRDGFPVYANSLGPDGQPQRDKDNRIKKHLSWDFSHANRLRFGHYTAQLLLVYNDGVRDVPVSGSVSFWVIPWRLLGGILIVVVLMGIGLWSSLRKSTRFFKHHAKRGRRDKTL